MNIKDFLEKAFFNKQQKDSIKYSVLRQAKPRLTILETELAKSWLTPEEDKAWKNL